MTIKIIVSLSIGIILILLSIFIYLVNKKKSNSQMKLKHGITHWFVTTLPLIFLISGVFVILFGCLNF